MGFTVKKKQNKIYIYNSQLEDDEGNLQDVSTSWQMENAFDSTKMVLNSQSADGGMNSGDLFGDQMITRLVDFSGFNNEKDKPLAVNKRNKELLIGCFVDFFVEQYTKFLEEVEEDNKEKEKEEKN